MPRHSTIPVVHATLSSSFSSVVFAVMPKCPACLVLLLAPLGVKAPGSKLFLAWMVLMLAAVPMTLLLTPACRRSGIGPLLLALAGLATMTIGKIAVDSWLIVAAGAVAMFSAAFWTARSAMVGCSRTESHGSGA